jgi:hypothetical protein
MKFSFNISFFQTREWSAVDERFKVQQDKCTAMLSIAMERKNLTHRNERILVSLFHCNMLSLAVLERVSTDSDELKSLQSRITYLIDDILFDIGKDFEVSITYKKITCISTQVS